ncbi:HAD family hydrolase [Alkalihalobacillus sp. LMS39]|uniref:HAD family hydrolase n=1 Tax=Alkalihalobacillus sp. LMS39 TaxID=2924032 RepID=UPI001FB46711|nr:HAD family hydrolase [Alkalihalobacillus sp. LMS39]UOE93587.1 HAD family hydrolase [Alkalihalobacillus sp. LMS39]
MKKAILFDVDDTMYDQQKPFADAILSIGLTSLPSSIIHPLYIRSRYYSDLLWDEYGRGELTLQELRIERVRRAFKDFQLVMTNDDALLFQQHYERNQAKIKPFPELLPLLSDLQSLNYEIGVLTNGPGSHQFAKIKTLGILPYVKKEFIFISDEVGVAKPNKQIFIHAAQTLKIDDEDLVYVGDNWTNDIVPSSQLGWQAIWYNHRQHKRGTEDNPYVEINKLDLVLDVLSTN